MKTLASIIAISGLFLTGCQSETWTAFYYPDGVEVEKTWQIRNGLQSKEECLDIALTAMDTSTNPVADYECGVNCKKMNVTMPYYICDETVQ